MDSVARGVLHRRGVWAGFAPLADPDLPMHLTVGEWICGHHRVPFEEPFAWTRAGEPYYAYSWIAQLAFFTTMRAFGPVGLHVLAGITAMAIVLAGFAVGRSMGLGVSRSTILGVLSIAIAMESTPFLRPQLFMFALLPLAWASAFRLVRSRSVEPRIRRARPVDDQRVGRGDSHHLSGCCGSAGSALGASAADEIPRLAHWRRSS